MGKIMYLRDVFGKVVLEKKSIRLETRGFRTCIVGLKTVFVCRKFISFSNVEMARNTGVR